MEKRYFTISDQILYCHGDTEKGLLRAMLLEKAQVVNVMWEYPDMIELSYQYYSIKLRAKSKEELKRWMKQKSMVILCFSLVSLTCFKYLFGKFLGLLFCFEKKIFMHALVEKIMPLNNVLQ